MCEQLLIRRRTPIKIRFLIGFLIVSILIVGLISGSVSAMSNPYPGGYSDCTWTAWQLAYERLGIELPAFGYSYNWCSGAAASGIPTGTVPEANAIVVWDGHVGFVAQTDGTNIYVMEGGWNDGYHEGWYNGEYGISTSSSGKPLIGYVYLKNVPANVTPVTTSSSASEVAERNEELAELQNKKASLEKQIAQTESEVADLTTTLEEQKIASGQRIRSLYMIGDDTILSLLFGSHSFSDLFSNIHNMCRVLESDYDILCTTQENIERLDEKLAELEESREALDEIKI